MRKRNEGRERALGIYANTGDLEHLRKVVSKRDHLVFLGTASEGCGHLMRFIVGLVADGGIEGLRFGTLDLIRGRRAAMLSFLTVSPGRWSIPVASALEDIGVNERAVNALTQWDGSKSLPTGTNVVFLGRKEDHDMANMFAGAMADSDFDNNFMLIHGTN
jgi:hypothetical protein